MRPQGKPRRYATASSIILDDIYSRAQKTACLIGDEPKGDHKVYKQDNPEADGILHDLHTQEYQMAKILSKINENSESYRSKLQKLREMVKWRKELERMLHYKVFICLNINVLDSKRPLQLRKSET